MSVRGFIRVRAPDGSFPYEQFAIDSQETVRFDLDQVIAGTASALDVSAANIEVHFRGSISGATPIPVNVTLTKTNGGSDGIVDGIVVFRRADFSTVVGLDVECGVYVVDTNTADPLTPSTSKETLWKGKWLATVQAEMEAGS